MPKTTEQPIKLRTIIIAGLAIIAGLLVLSALLAGSLRPKTEDFSSAKTNLAALEKANNQLSTASNKYINTLNAEIRAAGSVEKAAKNSQAAYKDFMAIEEVVAAEREKLRESKAARDGQVNEAVKQLDEASQQRASYHGSLVRDYADYQALFSGKNNQVCFDVLVARGSGPAELQENFAKAAENCFKAINKLKSSENSSLQSYARQLERQVKQMESSLDGIAKNENNLTKLEKKAAELKQKVAELEEKKANQKEIDALRQEISDINSQTSSGFADFKFLSGRYDSARKETPEQFAALYKDKIYPKLENHDSIANNKEKILTIILDDKQQ